MQEKVNKKCDDTVLAAAIEAICEHRCVCVKMTLMLPKIHIEMSVSPSSDDDSRRGSDPVAPGFMSPRRNRLEEPSRRLEFRVWSCSRRKTR